MSEHSYHDQVNKENIEKMRAVLQELPKFCKQFFRGIENTTSTRTRLGYALDLRIFFEFIQQNNNALRRTPIQEYPLSLLDQLGREDIEEYLDYLELYYKDDKEYRNDERGKSRKLASLRSMYHYFYTSELIEKDVAALVPMPKLHEKEIIRLDPEMCIRDRYEYLGVVKNPDGSPMLKYICFDPAVLNDDGTIRLYYGTQYDYEERDDFLTNDFYLQDEIEMFGRSREEIFSYPDSIMGPVMAVLSDDMLTVKEEAKHIIPYRVKGTSFEAHPFFEGSSMRKVGKKYYFIYSSWQNHELCYATSDQPDRDFVFGGTIVSNGDIGYRGRDAQHKLNMTGTTHGSIIEINGQWYVFYHRLTHKSDYSRQACAEKIRILEDGSIPQAEMTSCGLNDGPLSAEGTYPAVIACNLTNGHMPHGSNSVFQISFPNVTHKGQERFIAEIEDHTLIGYKYFECRSVKQFGITYRMETEKNRVIFDGRYRTDVRSQDDENFANTYAEKDTLTNIVKPRQSTENTPQFGICIDTAENEIGTLLLDEKAEDWKKVTVQIEIPDGVHTLYLVYKGQAKVQLIDCLLYTSRCV